MLTLPAVARMSIFPVADVILVGPALVNVVPRIPEVNFASPPVLIIIDPVLGSIEVIAIPPTADPTLNEFFLPALTRAGTLGSPAIT